MSDVCISQLYSSLGSAKTLEYLYSAFHKPALISPDPLEVVREYDLPEEREIAALIASSLALGRVECIVQAVRRVLGFFSSLQEDLLSASLQELSFKFRDFRYRFFSCTHIVSLLWAVRQCILDFGSLKNCFTSFFSSEDDSVIPALEGFVRALTARSPGDLGMLLSSPEKGSACKRLFLFLRWMVRCDAVDPGGWDTVSPALLIIPVDTHVLQVARCLGFTEKKQADLRTAVEITNHLRRINPEDPVIYDFSMTRPGIHPEIQYIK